jgi:hypothetical protein
MLFQGQQLFLFLFLKGTKDFILLQNRLNNIQAGWLAH